MSKAQFEGPVWQAIMADPRLTSARRKLSFHEIRLIVRHAQGAPVPSLRALAVSVLQAHEWGYRDPVVGGFIEHRLPFDLANAVLSETWPHASDKAVGAP